MFQSSPDIDYHHHPLLLLLLLPLPHQRYLYVVQRRLYHIMLFYMALERIV